MSEKTAEGMIRVLHPITRLIVGGAQENTMYTAALMDKKRFHVEVLSGPQTGSEGSLIEEVRSRGVPLTILPDLLRQISPMHDLRALWQMARFMRRGNYQIVHTHSSKAGILGRLAARIAGVPIIVHTVHGWSFHDYMSPILRWTYILLERWVAWYTDALIVVTTRDVEKGLRARIGKPEPLTRSALSHERTPYHLIRSAIPLDAFDPTRYDRLAIRQELDIPQDAIVIGNVGRFSAQKNPLDWIRVAGQVARSHPLVHFLLVGDGPLRSKVETALVVEGVADRTTLTGLRRDVPRMLAAMDIFLLTSLWEGLPRVLPQAMAMGLPIISNATDGTTEAIQDGVSGYLCNPGDLEALSERCLLLVDDPDQRFAMGQNGRAFARQEFDLQKMIAQIETLYDRLLSDTSILP